MCVAVLRPTVMWTAPGRTGVHCDTAADGCVRMQRKLVLTLSDDKKSVQAGIMPDSSVNHYAFTVAVSLTGCNHV